MREGRIALGVACAALALAATDGADAARQAVGKVVRLGSNGKVPAKVLPKVPRAQRADRLGDKTAEDLELACGPTTVDMGTWCLSASVVALTPEEAARNDFFFASRKCVALGGWLPTAAQLVGAADRVRLASTLDDDDLTASVDIIPTDGLKDRREMSATLVTTAAGSTAAGSQGVSDGSRGDPRVGEPDPAPQAASPAPETLQYVTVYDNRNRGGFAGSKPVTQPENFRCGFDKAQGVPQEEQ